LSVKKKVASLAILTLLILGMLSFAFNIKPAKSSHTTTIYFDPSGYIFNAAEVSVGYKFNATIRVSNVENLAAWQVWMYYNTTILRVSRYFEPVWDPEYVFYGKSTFFAFGHHDTYSCVGAGIYPVTWENAFSGSGKLVIIEFEILKVPGPGEAYSSILNIDNDRTYLLDPGVNEIPAVKENGYYLTSWLLHDVSVGLDTPTFFNIDCPTLLNVTVWNLGLSNETNVEVYLLINGTVACYVLIPELLSGHFYSLTHLWTPQLGGVFNVTAYIPPVPGENATKNNIATKFIKWAGTIYIRADGSIYPPNVPIVSHDNVTYTLTNNITIYAGFDGIIIQRDNIIVDGAGYTICGVWESTGIIISGRSNITVKNLRVEAFTRGMVLDHSFNCSIIGSYIEGALILSGSSGNRIIQNTITTLGVDWARRVIYVTSGLVLDESSSNIFFGNLITGVINTREIIGFYMGQGINLWWSSNNNIFYGNTIIYNYYGVSMHGGPSNNKFYHNNFIENGHHVDDAGQFTGWDDGYPSGGNYWSDYVGVDVKCGPAQDLPGSDGIGDTPYIIDADNRDRYPLMYPYGTSPPSMYSLTIVATVGGTTDPVPGTYFYTANSEVQVTAIPTIDYDFDHWELDTINVGSANPYIVLMNNNHTLKAVFTYSPRPPLSVSISPPSASMLMGQSVTFTSTVSGGYTPYTYQWFLNGNPVSGATSNTWTFTPTTSGIFYVYLKVTDARGNTAQSDAARVVVSTVPVGGYSIPPQLSTKTDTVIPYTLLVTVLTATFIAVKRKYKKLFIPQ
jgi:parallel beta-helix repeat protein